MPIRLFLALLLALGLAGSAVAAPGRDWRTVITRAPSGGYLLGNPAAKVKLVEYQSYTCPHCAEFAKESAATLRNQMVRDGSVQIEFRPAVRDRFDLAATLLARCLPPARFLAANDLLFARQDEWFDRATSWSQYNERTVALYPETPRLKAYAIGAGLPALLGLSETQVDQCLADSADRARVASLTDAAWATIPGTPTFVLNGQTLHVSKWAELEPKLRAAGAR